MFSKIREQTKTGISGTEAELGSGTISRTKNKQGGQTFENNTQKLTRKMLHIQSLFFSSKHFYCSYSFTIHCG